MKKNIYDCEKCSREIVTADREVGTTPFMIGCTDQACSGMARSRMYRVDQTLEPELIFIAPSNEKEWKAIEEELKSDLKARLPRNKKHQFGAILNNVMEGIQDHVRMGGICHLPAKTVLAFQNIVKFEAFHTSIWNAEHVDPETKAKCELHTETPDGWIFTTHEGYFVKTNFSLKEMKAKFAEMLQHVYPTKKLNT